MRKRLKSRNFCLEHENAENLRASDKHGILGAAGQHAEAAGIETDLPSMLAQVRPAVVSIRTAVSGITTSDALDDPNIRKALGIPEDVLIVQSGVTARVLVSSSRSL